MALRDFEGEDFAACFAAIMAGLFAQTLMPGGAWALYGPPLLSFHLFLGWLVFVGGKRNGVPVSWAAALLTHACCLFLVVAVIWVTRGVPYSNLFRYATVVVAMFERAWLFNPHVEQPVPEEELSPSSELVATPEETRAWQRYLERQNPGAIRPGTSLKAEYDQWLRARRKRRETVRFWPRSR